LKIPGIELIRNIASLFGRHTVSASCSYQRQMLHIWLHPGGCEN